MHKTVGLCLLLIFLIVSSTAAEWIPDHVRYIDSAPEFGNFLFRGSLPVSVDGEFLYLELQRQLQIAARFDGVVLPNVTFNIVDVSFLMPFGDELQLLEAEQKFFDRNPQAGKLINYSVFGDTISAELVPLSTLKDLSTALPTWQMDNIPKAVEMIRDLLHTNYSRPTVVYIHCAAGMDRTGMVSGSYYMRYLEWKYAQSLSYDNTCFFNRPISPLASNGMQWYCFYLQFVNGYSSGCKTPAELPSSNCHMRI